MNSSRRSFLKTAAITLSTLPFLGRLSFAADAELPMAKEGEDVAKTLKFCSNGDKPNKGCDARKAKDKSKQYCYNCQLFARLDGDKKASKGKCLVMPKVRVPGTGWCNSWVQNPAVKD